jgi:hypothetical protein
MSSEARANNRVPDSCCKTVSRACGVRDHPSNIYYTGCSHSLAIMLARHLFLLGTGTYCSLRYSVAADPDVVVMILIMMS